MQTAPVSARARHWLARAALYVVLAGGAVLSLGPFYWTFVSSFKRLEDIFAYPPSLLPTMLSFANYRALLEQGPFLRNLANSLGVALAYTLVAVILSSMVGYGFARYRHAPGASLLLLLMLGSIMVPFQTLAISLFVRIARLGWINSYQGLVVPFMANAFSGYLMTQYMKSVPGEIIDAAHIDGCNELQAFWHAVLPIMRPALGAVGVLAFVHSWNDFFWPLIVLSKRQMFTVPVVLGSFIAEQTLVPHHMIVAGITLATVPLIVAFILAQRQFIAGLTMGAVK